MAACAQGCVGISTASCKPTDYTCMCNSADYISKLTGCIYEECDETESAAAKEFLEELCSGAGSPITISSKGATANSDDTSDNEALENDWKGMEDHPLELRQETELGTFFETGQTETGFPTETGITTLPTITDTFTTAFTGTGTITGTARTGSPTTGSRTIGSPTTSTSTPTPNNRGGGGLSTGAKVGIGLGVPLGAIIIAGLVGLGWFLRRRSKNKAAAVANSQPEMVGPAKLGGASQSVGAELPTKGNTHEMPAGAWMGQPQGQFAPAELGENR
ncbi:hypothetical protein BU16DRAFT_562308 [Lophium mytilinum]|uniref:CFEM domain-containing protein n=1 Tax=Lophium mytilinum TaxID=390894 RepID=A0A6A6QQ96_9PEZI|nr:hypothetical protein BU16DRAFT_562308 [Lophium mytilinum]